MLKKAKELNIANPDSISFIDFSDIDFDTFNILEPSKIDRAIWKKFIEITLDDFTDLISPSQVVFCEGNQAGRKYKNFDAQVFTKIFGSVYPDVSFFSVGSASELENPSNTTFKVIQDVLASSTIIKVVDKDDKNEQEVKELLDRNIKTLSLRHIESYLLDDEIITKLCILTNNTDKVIGALELKGREIEKSKTRGNPSDDVKSASGDIYVGLKKLLSLTSCGNTKDAFFRDTLCPLITPDTLIFQKLQNEIFG